jgi:hypothetical protein
MGMRCMQWNCPLANGSQSMCQAEVAVNQNLNESGKSFFMNLLEDLSNLLVDPIASRSADPCRSAWV